MRPVTGLAYHGTARGYREDPIELLPGMDPPSGAWLSNEEEAEIGGTGTTRARERARTYDFSSIMMSFIGRGLRFSDRWSVASIH